MHDADPFSAPTAPLDGKLLTNGQRQAYHGVTLPNCQQINVQAGNRPRQHEILLPTCQYF